MVTKQERVCIRNSRLHV